jgi:sporulation protein YlmC with PRC-barrel domain
MLARLQRHLAAPLRGFFLGQLHCGLMGAGTLAGNNVYNHKGKELGYIKGNILDMRSCKAGQAVPWNVLTLDTKNKRFVSFSPQGRFLITHTVQPTKE